MIDTPPLTEHQIPIPALSSGRLRLSYLDGLRGITAFYVLLHHIYTDANINNILPHSIERFLRWLLLGHYAVGIFIVVSGYSLMLPITRSDSGMLAGGLKDYLHRRARRILPPYYAALLLTLLCALIVPSLRMPSGTLWSNHALPIFTPGVILSHLALLHNINPAWEDKINPPFWSVATEWQIYFIFPLVLLPVWKRFGNLAAVWVALAIGLILDPFYVHASSSPYPIYVELFACGMVAATINFPVARKVDVRISGLPYGLLTLGFAGLIAFLIKVSPKAVLPTDILVGFGTASFLIYCTNAVIAHHAKKRPLPVTLLELGPSHLLGKFSYSLYLTHMPVLTLVHLALQRQGFTEKMRLVLEPPIAIPLCLVCAYGFYLIFERPFSSPLKKIVPVN